MQKKFLIFKANPLYLLNPAVAHDSILFILCGLSNNKLSKEMCMLLGLRRMNKIECARNLRRLFGKYINRMIEFVRINGTSFVLHNVPKKIHLCVLIDASHIHLIL